MMIPLQMNHLLRMTTELWHHAGPEHNVRLRRKYKGQSPTYFPHASRIAIGIQRCEILAEFLPSYLKVSEDYERHSQDLWRTSSSRLAEFASSSSATRRHVCNRFYDIVEAEGVRRVFRGNNDSRGR